MKQIEKEIKSGGKVVSKIKIDQAESSAECLKLAGGEKEMIAIFNAQYATNQMNKVRKPGDGGFSRLVSKAAKEHPELKDALAKVLEKYGVKAQL